MNPDLTTLKLHVAEDGIVWSLYADGKPESTKLGIVGFLASKKSKIESVRLIGNQTNAQLLVNLYALRNQRGEGCIEVCSPMVCKTAEERRDPYRALLAMRKCQLPPSIGGWHIFKNTDAISYSLVSQMQKIGGIDDYVRRLVRAHSAWPALSFIANIDLDKCALIMADILDPRWFIDIKHPNRGSRLRSRFGLDMKTLKGVVGKGPRQRGHNRCKLVMDTWGYTVQEKSLIEKPDHFLYRIVRQSVENDKEYEHGLLRATQTFLEYFRLVWLASFGIGKKQPEALFVPEYFFNQDSEVVSFKEHMQKAIYSD